MSINWDPKMQSSIRKRNCVKFARNFTIAALGALALATMTACAPEVGSEKWCAQMKEKPKKDWTAQEAADYTKHCVFE